MSRLKLVGLLLAAVSIFATVCMGQDSIPPGPVPHPSGGWLGAVAAFLYNPITLSLAMLVIQFVPGVRAIISNAVAPLLTTAMAWIGGLLSPGGAAQGAWMIHNDPTSSTNALAAFVGSVTPMAHADGGVHVATVGVIGLFGLGLGGLLGGIGGAALQAMQGYLINRMYAWPGRLLPALPKDSV